MYSTVSIITDKLPKSRLLVLQRNATPSPKWRTYTRLGQINLFSFSGIRLRFTEFTVTDIYLLGPVCSTIALFYAFDNVCMWYCNLKKNQKKNQIRLSAFVLSSNRKVRASRRLCSFSFRHNDAHHLSVKHKSNKFTHFFTFTRGKTLFRGISATVLINQSINQ